MASKPRPSDLARQFFTTIAKASQVEPVYYLYGEESYLLDRAVEALVKAAAPEGVNDFNYDGFYGKDVSIEQLCSAVETLPFMCKRRVVLVRDVQEMDIKQLEGLGDYLDNPSPSTCLILHAMTAQKSIDGRSSIVKKLKKVAQSFEFKAFYENEVEQFLHKQASLRQMRITDAAAAHLVEAVGTSLAELDKALDKLDLYMGAQDSARTIEVEMIHEIIAQTKINSVFELTDALGDKRAEDALNILDKMMLMGESAIMINQMVARHFRILLKLKDPSVRNAGNAERAKAAGVSPYFLKDYQRHADKFSGPQLRQIMAELLITDMALKSSKLSDKTIVEALLLKIVHPGGASWGVAYA